MRVLGIDTTGKDVYKRQEQGIDEKWYPEKDYHTLYICEIETILKK